MLVNILILLMPLVYAEDTGATPKDVWTDNLVAKDDIKQYEFEMTEAGDAIISITGLQERWDGYTYHWRCTVYRTGSETALAYADVSGYSGNAGPSVISVTDLEAGTYCIQMTSVSFANPLLSTFTSDPYEISLIKSYYSCSAAYNGNGVQTFRNAGAVVWTFDRTAFIKLNDGECFCALMDSCDGAIVPVLIAPDARSVEYVISSTGKMIEAAGPWHDEASGTDYYYSQCRYIDPYTEESIDTSAFPIVYFNTNSVTEASERIANLLKIEDTKESDAPQAESAQNTAEAKEKKVSPAGTGENASGTMNYKEMITACGIGALGMWIIIILKRIASNRRKRRKKAASYSDRHPGYRSHPSYGSAGSIDYGGYSDTFFDPKSYVDRNCHNQIYGIVSATDIDTIDNDPNLTFEEKEATKSELRHQADIYY